LKNGKSPGRASLRVTVLAAIRRKGKLFERCF